MPKAGGKLPNSTDEEEARVQAGIAADLDNPEWSDEDFARAKPASKMLPSELYAALTKPRGRPKAEETKQPVKLRLDRATVTAFMATGDGWQTRMNDALAAAAKKLPKSSAASSSGPRRG